ncbi:MAG: hypothetical protein DWH96_02840 [Planctomycetota bacterium]|nr:MAG: hypothetical protein DWH96_02840 [Planctomycetota bacterium]RLS95198.1 MAG: hypothetical protein DWI11_03260 [Planctomycetota bacterium]
MPTVETHMKLGIVLHLFAVLTFVFMPNPFGRVHAQTQIPLPNASFEDGPQVNMDPYPVGTVLPGGWSVVPGAVSYWGVERRSLPQNGSNCFGFSNGNSGAYGVLLGSVNQGGMTQAGIELVVSGLPQFRLYEFRAVFRGQVVDGGTFNELQISCGTGAKVEPCGMLWREVAVRGLASSKGLTLRLKALMTPNGNNSCWAPIVDDVSLFDLGPDCDGNLVPDSTDPDCNGNAIPDACDILAGHSSDYNADGIPDECGCISDLNEDGAVNGNDLAILLAFWGPVSTFPRADIDRDQYVGGGDLAITLSNWGPCSN